MQPSDGALQRVRLMSAPARHSGKRSGRTAPGGVLLSWCARCADEEAALLLWSGSCGGAMQINLQSRKTAFCF